MFFATGGYVGLMPVAPGTFGSLIGLPLLLGLARLGLGVTATVALVGGAALAAMAICHEAGRALGDADSGQLVLDEVCGMLVAGLLLDPTPWILGLAFLFFRVFDVLKPFPARWIDRSLKNGVGVVADDLVAGLYTNVLVRVLA